MEIRRELLIASGPSGKNDSSRKSSTRRLAKSNPRETVITGDGLHSPSMITPGHDEQFLIFLVIL